VPVLALLGIVLAISGLARFAPRAQAPEATATGVVEVALAAALVALELVGGNSLSLRTTADWLDVVLTAAGIAVTAILGREPLAPDDLTAELGRRVGAVLGVSMVEVRFPADHPVGGAVDTHGHPVQVPGDSSPIRTADGAVVALVSPWVSMTSGTEHALAQRLLPLAAHARLNDRLRRQNDELADSRRRLAGAADQERHRVEESLSGSVLRRLDKIGGLLDDTPAPRHALARVRREIADLVDGLDPLRGRTLSAALREDWADRVSLVGTADDVPPAVAATAWWILAEAVTNALKHAPGAHVVVTTATIGDELVVRVADDGPGGADPRGRGLLGAADRAAVVDGRLTIHSDDTGTTLEVRLPTGKGQPLQAVRSAPDPAAVGTP
jgi:signal transduction histidine kinase